MVENNLLAGRQFLAAAAANGEGDGEGERESSRYLRSTSCQQARAHLGLSPFSALAVVCEKKKDRGMKSRRRNTPYTSD